MQINSPHFIIENESELGWKFHWLRAEHEEPIDICVRRLGVSIDTVDKIESGRFDEPQIDLELLILYLALYDEKFHLSFEGD